MTLVPLSHELYFPLVTLNCFVLKCTTLCKIKVLLLMQQPAHVVSEVRNLHAYKLFLMGRHGCSMDCFFPFPVSMFQHK